MLFSCTALQDSKPDSIVTARMETIGFRTGTHPSLNDLGCLKKQTLNVTQIFSYNWYVE